MAVSQNLISILMPTRGRRQLAEQFINTAFSRATYPDQLEIIVYTDEDDIVNHDLSSLNKNVTTLIGPQVTTGAMYTSCLEKAKGNIIVLGSDDVEILAMGWDTAFRAIDATYPDGIYLAYPNDLHKGKCTFPVMSRRCTEILGDPYPVEYLAAFIDTHLFDIFQRLKQQGCSRVHFLQGIQFDHRHPRAGKSPVDPVYRNRPRFSGDITFLSQINKRAEQAATLVADVNNLPKPSPTLHNQSYPTRLGPRIFFIFRYVACDRGLPILWRTYFATFLIARSIVSTFYKS